MFIGKASKSQRAFTLVEVLIAMVIFSLVMTLAVSSYRYSLQNLSKQGKNNNLAALTTQKLINKQIRTALPFYYTLYTGSNALFFEGTESSVQFITDHPILIDSPLAVVELKVSENEVSYCEIAFGSVSLESVSKGTTCDKKITYLEGNRIQLHYFGWKDSLELDNYYSEYLSINVKPSPKWSSEYSATQRGVLPLFLKISLSSEREIVLKIPEVNSYQRQGSNNGFEG